MRRPVFALLDGAVRLPLEARDQRRGRRAAPWAEVESRKVGGDMALDATKSDLIVGESGVTTPTDDEFRRLDRERKDKKVGNAEWTISSGQRISTRFKRIALNSLA